MTTFTKSDVKFNGQNLKGGFISEFFATVKIGYRKWAVIHKESGTALHSLVSLNSATAKARIEALEAAFNWKGGIENLLENNGFEVTEAAAHEFHQKCEDIALPIEAAGKGE